MSIHKEETMPLANAVVFLFLLFLLVYPLWKLGVRDLFWDEGEYAAIISEMHSFPPDGRAHGELISGYYPLYPMLVKGLVMLGLGMEYSLRLISVAALGGLTVMVGITGYRLAGVHAGAAAASVMFTTLIAAEKAVEGYPNTLLVLLIFSGWLLWFYLGQFGGSWNLGWAVVGLFAGLSFYCGGWTALFYFLIPMMFLQRPFTPWRRLTGIGFPAGVLILLAFVLMWVVPRWTPGAGRLPLPEGSSFGEYVFHLFDMTGDIAFRFLPWTFFLYAPYCAALIVIDRNPLFSKYLRILFTVSALTVILDPFSKARDILYLTPAFALLTGLNYEIVVRRHGTVMCRILRWGAVILFLCGTAVLLYELLPASLLTKIAVKMPPEQIAGRASFSCLLEASGAAVIAVAAYWLAVRKRAIWLEIVMLFAGGMLCFYSLTTPRRALQRSRSETGMAFRTALGGSYRPDLTVYKDSSIAGLYTECYYMGTKVKTIAFSETDGIKDQTLFLLSPSSIQPPDSSRSWNRTMDIVYKKKNLYMWKGVLNDRKEGSEHDIRNMRF